MGILTKKRVYPCEPARAKVLSAVIWGSAYGGSDSARTLRRFTCGITEDEIPWHAVSAVSMIGTAEDQCNVVLAEEGLQSGIYVNRTGDRLLLIHPGETAMGQYLARLGTRLKELELYNSTFQRLDLSSLTALEQLSMWNNEKLESLKGLGQLTNLSSLDLSYCSSLREIPQGLNRIKSLRKLDLRFMKLRTLPYWLPEIVEQFSMSLLPSEEGNNRAIVYLYGTTVDDIPDMSIFDQPYEMVVKWFEDRKRGKTRKLNEIKVVFLGDGEAGKSHTIARLINNGGAPKDYVDVRTPGIVIKDIPYPIGEREVVLHLWDFGGQDILHSMHRIFLTERTIYVVLVDGSTGTQDDRARYWLQNIQSFAKDAPVVLVLNKLDDGLQADVNAVDLRNKFKGLKQIVKLSALQYPQERFNREFTDVLLQEIEKTGYLDAEWPSSWIDVKYELEHMVRDSIGTIEWE